MSEELSNKPAKSNAFFALMGAVMVVGLTFLVLTRTDQKIMPQEEDVVIDSTVAE
jgi:hypothetical protein